MPTFDEDVIVNGSIRVVRSGDGAVLLTLDSARGWMFRQRGTGAGAALELTADSPTNNNKNFIINTDGRVGIGTANPTAKLHVVGGPIKVSNEGDGAVLLTLGSDRGWVFRQRGTGESTALELAGVSATNNNKDFIINTEGDVTIGNDFIITKDGNVGIGTARPLGKLHVEGTIRVTDDIILDGADCAEEFDIDPDSTLHPGTVMVIGPRQRLHHCSRPYDTRVAGVISGAGDRRPGLLLGRREGASSRSRVPLALTGTVHCNVDAAESPIEIGDLLTTSSTPGHAMRATDRSVAVGAVLGKSLASLTTGAATLPILVALQ